MLTLKHHIENLLQVHGKKFISEKLIRSAIKLLQKKTLKNFIDIIIFFILNNIPVFNIKIFSRKKKKKNHTFVPFFLTKQFRRLASLKTIITTTKNKMRIKSFIKVQKLFSTTLYTSSNNDLASFKYTLHRAVYFKKSFFHYRWF